MKYKKINSNDVTWYTNKGKKLCGSTVATSDGIVLMKEMAEQNGYPGTPNGIRQFASNGSWSLMSDEIEVLNCYIEAGEGDVVHNWR